MKRLAAAFVLAALAGCAPAPTQPAPSPSPTATPKAPMPAPPLPDAISVGRYGIWGANPSEWRIEKNGSVLMQSDFQKGPRTTRFTIPASEYRAIREMLGALERRRDDPLAGGCATDQAGAVITWRYGTRKDALMIDASCAGADQAAAFATLDAVGHKLETLGEAAADRRVTIGAQ
jgi:hypothetical protein